MANYKTGIGWAGGTINMFTGCGGCSVYPYAGRSKTGQSCYAREIAENPFFARHYPNGFAPTFHPERLDEVRRLRPQGRKPWFNSMADMFDPRFAEADQFAGLEAMRDNEHGSNFLTLSKQVSRMRDRVGRWLERSGLDQVPPNIWLGTSIEDAEHMYRADRLREIPCLVRALSLEPMLGPVADALDLTGISWVISGGESGSKFRISEPPGATMDEWDAWNRDVRDRCAAAGCAFEFKQHPHRWPGRGTTLDGRTHDEVPVIVEVDGW